MGRGGGQIDYALVERMRAQNASWSTVARSCGVPEDTLRRHCDPKYVAPDLSAAAERTPKLASGRENRPSAYEAPTLRTPLPPVNPPPVARMAVASMPTADQVARALVAAARVLGENPLTVALPLDGGRKMSRRFRFTAFAALRARFPAVQLQALGRMTGVPLVPSPAANVHVAKSSKWWPVIGDQAVEAAMSALEG